MIEALYNSSIRLSRQRIVLFISMMQPMIAGTVSKYP